MDLAAQNVIISIYGTTQYPYQAGGADHYLPESQNDLYRIKLSQGTQFQIFPPLGYLKRLKTPLSNL